MNAASVVGENDEVYNSHGASDPQWDRLMDFLSTDPDMLSGFVSSPNGHAILKDKWNKVAKIVNKCGPACKNGEKWKEAWEGLKTRSKRMYLAKCKDMQATGGGPGSCAALQPIQRRVMGLINPISVTGREDVPNPLRLQNQYAGQAFQQQVQPVPNVRDNQYAVPVQPFQQQVQPAPNVRDNQYAGPGQPFQQQVQPVPNVRENQYAAPGHPFQHQVQPAPTLRDNQYAGHGQPFQHQVQPAPTVGENQYAGPVQPIQQQLQAAPDVRDNQYAGPGQLLQQQLQATPDVRDNQYTGHGQPFQQQVQPATNVRDYQYAGPGQHFQHQVQPASTVRENQYAGQGQPFQSQEQPAVKPSCFSTPRNKTGNQNIVHTPLFGPSPARKRLSYNSSSASESIVENLADMGLRDVRTEIPGMNNLYESIDMLNGTVAPVTDSLQEFARSIDLSVSSHSISMETLHKAVSDLTVSMSDLSKEFHTSMDHLKGIRDSIDNLTKELKNLRLSDMAKCISAFNESLSTLSKLS